MFWLPFGTAAAVVGLALMTIGVARTAADANLFSSVWFDGGLGLLAIGAALLLLSLILFLSRRRDAAQTSQTAATAATTERDARHARDQEAIRGYFKERDRLFRLWERDRKNRR